MLSLSKGKIYACDEKGNKGESLEFSFNPSSYTIKSRPVYKSVPAVGQDGTDTIFIHGAARDLSVTLFFDSASDASQSFVGIQEAVKEDKLPPVTDKTKKLAGMVRIKGSSHTPPMVIFSWGNLNFKGVITSITEEYTMFTVQGKPIRAKVQLTIKEDLDEALTKKTSPFESPDRTKSRVVVEGMSLWSLAYEEYDDCEKWRVIAKANHIMNPLDILPGQVLKIPALDNDYTQGNFCLPND